jgi:voltage-gated potassium channel
VLSFAWLLVIVGQLLHPTSALLAVFGTAIWAVFILDFTLKLALAPAKARFLRRNWLAALALIVPALRLVRVLAVLRVVTVMGGGQLLMVIGTVNRTMNALRVSLGRRQVAFVFSLTTVVLLLGAAGMLRLEPHATTPQVQGFTGYGDALWWTAMLMTTIGSAYWPQTPAGRILAFLLSLYSLAVFGYITAALASFFVGQDASQKSGPIAGSGDMAALREEIRALREEIRTSRATDALP